VSLFSPSFPFLFPRAERLFSSSPTAYLLNVNSTSASIVAKAQGASPTPSSVYSARANHPWFSPSLPSALPNLTAVARAYLSPSPSSLRTNNSLHSRHHDDGPLHPFPLRFYITTGTSELFFPEVHALISNLRSASRSAAVEAGSPSAEPFVVESLEAEGEVHAFPLVPEWISPASRVAWKRIRRWAVDGVGDAAREEEKAGRNGKGSFLVGSEVGTL
jgi:hypothetical protein